jgi:hypothetical protein
VQDIFDDNIHAHNPTTDFLNFAFTTLGDFDDAADARGYSFGITAELKKEMKGSLRRSTNAACSNGWTPSTTSSSTMLASMPPEVPRTFSP